MEKTNIQPQVFIMFQLVCHVMMKGFLFLLKESRQLNATAHFLHLRGIWLSWNDTNYSRLRKQYRKKFHCHEKKADIELEAKADFKTQALLFMVATITGDNIEMVKKKLLPGIERTAGEESM